MEISLLSHQYQFINDTTTRYLGLVAGFAAGKTEAFCVKGIHLALMNPGHDGVLCEPTHSMIKDVLLPRLTELLIQMNIKYTYTASPYPNFTLKLKGGDTKIMLRSAENFDRLRGLNLAFFGVDEADCIPKQKAIEMCRVLQSRLRKGKVIQGMFVGTPEGFNFMHHFFVENSAEDRKFIKASTYNNPFLPPEYIQSLLENYPPELISAYLEGEFVNLTSGRVYTNFNRVDNGTILTLHDFDLMSPNGKATIHIGQDFNIHNMTSVVHTIDDKKVYAVTEHTKIRDTTELVAFIQKEYPSRKVIFYPDAAGSQQKTSATMSDIQIIKRGGFEVRAPSKNPFVKDRVASVNTMILNGKGDRKYFVNTSQCPMLTKTLEQQAYKDGVPDKGNDLDHPGDATGYFVHHMFPVNRSGTTQHSMY